jgi:hypothetical protein
MDALGDAPIGTFQDYGGRTDPGGGWFLCDGRPMGRTSYPDLFAAIVPVINTVTVNISTPAAATFTLTAHGLEVGDTVMFTTTGAMPTGVTPDTTVYYVASAPTADTFTLGTGAASGAVTGSVVTSGSQSGTHTLRYCPFGLPTSSPGANFLLPDTRGRCVISPRNMLSSRGTTGAATLQTNLIRPGRTDREQSNVGLEQVQLTGLQSGVKQHSHVNTDGTSGATGTSNISASTNSSGNVTTNTESANHAHSGSVYYTETAGNHVHYAGTYPILMTSGGSSLAQCATGVYPGFATSHTQGSSHYHSWGQGSSGDDNHGHGAVNFTQTAPSFAIPPLKINPEGVAAATSAHNNLPLHLFAPQIVRVS